jgi:hypothetical protein
MNLSFEINENEVAKLQEMMEKMGIENQSMARLFDTSLSLLNWAIEQKEKGNKIMSVNYAEKVQVELSTPFLDNVELSQRRKAA